MNAPKTKLYIYDDDKRKVLEIDRDDPRLLFNYQHAPDGKIVFFKYRDHGPVECRGFVWRERAKDKWRYLYYGETRSELAQRVNGPLNNAILSLETQIANAHSRINEIRRNMLPIAETMEVKP